MKPLDRSGLAILFVALALVSTGAVFLGLHLAGPSDGARLQPGEDVWQTEGVVVTPLLETPGGLRPGDVVAAVDGRSMESWAQALFSPRAPRPRWQFGQTVTYDVLRDGRPLELAVSLGRYPLAPILAQGWGTVLFALVSQLVASFVFLRRPGEPAARVLFLWASGMTSATTWSFGLQVSDLLSGIGFWLFKATSYGAYMLFWIAGLHFALIFPRPHRVVLRWPWVTRAIYVVPYAVYPVYLAAVWPGASGVLDWLGRWIPGESVLALAYLALMVGAMVSNYRDHPDPVTRRKTRWLVLAALLSGGGGILLWLLPGILFGRPIISTNALGLLVLPFPVMIAVAIMRHHLFDIDILINRALVYGALTGFVVGTYIFVVGYLGIRFHAPGDAHATADLVVSLIATGLVAVLFQPLRDRLQRGVNRLMYGERDDPYAVLSRLGQRLEAALAPEAVLPTLVETVAQALKLPYAAIALKEAEGFKVAAEYRPDPLPPAPVLAVEPMLLTHQSEVVGQLILAPRAPGEAFSPADRRLLEDIAHQAGAAVHAVRLSADLRRSRERLVTAREEERRRLRRDLHDGLGPQLASQTLTLTAARRLLHDDPAAADGLLVEATRHAQTAITDIRRLVHDLRPPALDDLGLVPALRSQVTQYEHSGIRIGLVAPEHLPPLPAAVEVAAYRIVQEALTNVVRHSRASEAAVRLSCCQAHPPGIGDPMGSRYHLELEIADDGVGLSAARRAGVGLASMRERAEELGGTCAVESAPGTGTRVLVRLPLQH